MEYALEITVSILGGLLLIIAYFLKMIHSDVRRNTEGHGENKGKINNLQIQIDNEQKVRAIELKAQQENTQKALETLAKNIGDLTKDVRMLINKELNND